MLPVLRVLGLSLPVGPLFAILAFYAFNEAGARALGRSALAQEQAKWREWFGNASFTAGLIGLIGARLGYAARYYPLYLESPQMLLSIRPGSLALWPGLLAGGAALLFLLRRKGVSLAHITDATAIGLTAALAMLSLRNFLTGYDYGAPTTLPWGVNLWAATRHPVQLYELASLLIVLVILWRTQLVALPGEIFWHSLALYSFVQLLVDAFRANFSTWTSGIHTTQVMALVVLMAAMFVLSFYIRQREQGTKRIRAIQTSSMEARLLVDK
jgi:phosphatidylglycerol:prolipoprotein diacylglycerol transferase